MKDLQQEEHWQPHIPWTLLLGPSGDPIDWIKYDEYAKAKSNDKIIWSLGKKEYTLRGGINSITMQQSILHMESIIAVKNDTGRKRRASKPALTNSALFNRDSNRCAYCGDTFKRAKLTRDHVIPLSKNGPDIWENVVTCCFNCNQRKGNMMLEESGMKLIYTPYAPTHHENLILKYKNISQEQLEYLIIGVSPHSRVYKDYVEKKNKETEM